VTSFEQLFRESKGKPIRYNGKLLQLVDRLTLTNGQQLKLTFESVSSQWRQGVCLKTDGGFIVNGQDLKKSVVLWHDTAPREMAFRVRTRKGFCDVKNVWDTGDGVMQSWHNGAAMRVEKTPSGRRYRCNDGQPDDDFDDIVFLIEVLKSS
jgi:hypothetical protein